MVKRGLITCLVMMMGLCGLWIPYPLAGTNPSGGAPAGRLLDLLVIQQEDGTECAIFGEGDLSHYKTFTLTDPLRIVVDIGNVTPVFGTREFPVRSRELARVRIGTYPDRVRVVLDIADGEEEVPPYTLKVEGEKLLLLLGGMAQAKQVKEKERFAQSSGPTTASPDPVSPERASSEASATVTTGERAEGAATEETQSATAPQVHQAEASRADRLDLEHAIEIALENNFTILSARENIERTEQLKKGAFADFFPKLSVEGTYTWLSEQPTIEQGPTPEIPVFSVVPPGAQIGVIPGSPATSSAVGKQETWSVVGSVTQPIFTGGKLLNQYRLTGIGVDSARTALERSRQDLALEVVRDYFNVLNALAQKTVADKAVELLESQRNVSQEFYNVGMIPKNDLLQTEVQLAERIREQTVAGNAIDLAKGRFNVTLQRPVETPVELTIPARKYAAYPVVLEEAIRTAHERRLEIREQELRVEAREKEVRLEQSRYFPQVQLSYNLFKTEGRSFSALNEGWTVEAGATWNFWEWGKKYHEVSAARSQLLRDRYDLMQLKDQIALEVQEAYLTLTAAERNIFVAKKAVEQGEESFRMNQERYKEQVGTITEVLDGETLLRKAEADYFNALRNYNVAKAALRRAMGLKVYDPGEDAPAGPTSTEP